jgi:hypothetical protein
MSSDTELEKEEGGSLLLNDEVWIRCASLGYSGRGTLSHTTLGPLAAIRRDVQGEHCTTAANCHCAIEAPKAKAPRARARRNRHARRPPTSLGGILIRPHKSATPFYAVALAGIAIRAVKL